MGRKNSEARYSQKPTDREKRRAKRKKERQCRDIRRRIGGCVFILGFPLLLAGCIILIVTNVNKDQVLPSSLYLLGPLFTGFSILCFILGLLLTDIIDLSPLIQRLIPDNPKTCPFLYNLFKGNNNQQYIDQQTAIISAQQPPSKSALRKPPNPDIKADTKIRRGVTFSDSSAGSVENEKYSSQLSLVSLRNCKIHPSFEEEDDTTNKTKTDTVYIVSQSHLPIPDNTNMDDVFHSNEDIV